MAKYVPSSRDWVREQVDLYESSGGTEGTTLRDTGLPVIIVTHTGNKTGAIRKTPLMRVKDGNSYVLVGSQGGAPTDPVWVHNLRVNPDVEIRDETVVRAREVEDEDESALAACRCGVSALRGIPRAHRPADSGLCCRAVLARSPPRASPMIARHSPREASCGKLIWSSRAGCRMSWH